jgi:hypothetical protein
MLSMSRARMLLGRPRNAACCAALGLAVAAGMAAAVAVAAPDCAVLRCAAAADHFAAPVPTTPQVASSPGAVPAFRPADAGGVPTGPAPRP